MTHYTRSLNNNYKLYYIDNCPGARAVRLALRYYNVEFDEIKVNMMNGEHRTPEFLKMNPMHTVPVLEILDNNANNTYIWESRIILKYLADVDNIEIDKWLFWDMGFLYPNVGKIIYPRLFRNEEPNPEDIPKLIEKLEYLNTSLENRNYLVGNNLTIADLSCLTLVQNTQFRNDLIHLNYSNINRWMANIKNNFENQLWNEVMDPFNLNLEEIQNRT